MKTARDYLVEGAEHLANGALDGYWGPTMSLTMQKEFGRSFGDVGFEYYRAYGALASVLYCADTFDEVNSVNEDQLILIYLFAAEMVDG